MKPIKRSYTYNIRKLNGDLRLRVCWNSNMCYFSTGFRVNPDKFANGRCIRGSFHDNKPAALINKALEDLENKADQIFFKAEYEDRILAPEDLRAEMLGKPSCKPDLWRSLEQFIIEGEKQHQWAFNTIKSVRQVVKLLQKFDSKLTFEQITAEKLNEFVVYQQSNKLHECNCKSGQKGYTNSTIIKNCRVLRWALRWAADKGYINRDIEREFSPSLKTAETPVIFLKWDELMRVYNLDLSENRLLDETRDFFCFCCFTSLRFSDAFALTSDNINGDCIEVVTQKTNRLLRIELNKYSRAIIEKNRHKHGKYVLPHVPLDKIDYRLPKVGEMANISEPVTITRYYGSNKISKNGPKYKFLTSHCGRRTFICNALAMGIAPNVVMKWTGHSEYSAMKPYIDIADEIKAESMLKFDKM